MSAATRRLRIVLYEPAGRGGICHYTWELAEHLSRAGHDVTVMTTSDYELEHFRRTFRVRSLFKRSWIRRLLASFARSSAARPSAATPAAPSVSAARGSLRGARAARMRLLHAKMIARFLVRRPDVVHFQWLGDRDLDLRLMRLLRRLRIPVVYTAHDVLPHEQGSAADRMFLSQLYELPDRIIVHTEANRRELIDTFGVPRERTDVIPHGTYDFRFGRETATIGQEEGRRRLEIPTEKKVVLFFGLIKRYKGLEYLIDAFEMAERRLADVDLLVVGDLFRGDAEAYSRYSTLLDGLRGKKNVHVVTAYVPIEEAPVYFAACDVVALPYTQTSQSGVLLAAYGAGKPVIVTDTGGLPEIVEPGRTGLVVRSRDSYALADAIVKILNDPREARAMGERARELGATVYSWSNVARRTAEAYILSGTRQSNRKLARPRAKSRENVLSEAPRSAAPRS